jgi:RecA-family ATPase
MRAADCAVFFVHHMGKANARLGASDQYAYRGGSAFADAARMVHNMTILEPSEWFKETGGRLVDEDQRGIKYSMPKMSFCKHQQPFYLRREEWGFTTVVSDKTTKAERADADAEMIWSLFADELRQGRYYTKNSMEAKLKTMDSVINRADARDAITLLEAAGRLVNTKRPGSQANGARNYMHPVDLRSAESSDSGGGARSKWAENSDSAPPTTSATSLRRPLRKTMAAERAALDLSSFPPGRQSNSAERGGAGGAEPPRSRRRKA